MNTKILLMALTTVLLNGSPAQAADDYQASVDISSIETVSLTDQTRPAVRSAALSGSPRVAGLVPISKDILGDQDGRFGRGLRLLMEGSSIQPLGEEVVKNRSLGNDPIGHYGLILLQDEDGTLRAHLSVSLTGAFPACQVEGELDWWLSLPPDGGRTAFFVNPAGREDLTDLVRATIVPDGR